MGLLCLQRLHSGIILQKKSNGSSFDIRSVRPECIVLTDSLEPDPYGTRYPGHPRVPQDQTQWLCCVFWSGLRRVVLGSYPDSASESWVWEDA